ncbi:methyl-accepting chemotaxis protein [Aliidiomarina minuta]|uniref:Methyl-accepting chemotaxis protein n=1 Tax=Aliidiomarina minuta TaxID=880057 RepID=A0A432W4E9_9GAMM|nr:methyl-accepting chemotaxis protein [Aliidiomarina minuta]RUO24383.1 methyl-accepting chemotaxis protein [Aliidiomarina minuta]
MKAIWQNLGFGARLTLMIVSLVVISVITVASIVYVEYRAATTEATLNQVAGTSQSGTQSFMDWLLARQDEMRYLAQLDATRGRDVDQVNNLLATLADGQGYWDTIYLLDTSGVGQIGVSYDGNTQVLSSGEAAEFQVQDRTWYQQALRGNDVFSEPLVSRASGNRVSTVAIPVRTNGQITGVMRGAVMLDTIFERVQQLSVDGSAEIYLIDSDRRSVTTANSVPDVETRINTQAAEGIANQDNGVGIYRNHAGVEVVGSYNYIPLLGWGLTIEVPVSEALANVRAMFWSLVLIVSIIVVLSVLICLAIIRNVVKTIGGEPKYASEVVSKVASGDLTYSIKLKPGDKTSLLYSISVMQNQLKEIMSDISSYAEQVASASTELSQINGSTEQGIQQQNEQLSNAATAINEMSASAEEVARNTQDAADAAKNTNDEAETGQRVVSEAIQTVEQLADEIKKGSEVIAQLKSDSDQIGSVLEVIGGIADQTNLLALNAAIEAARAGESGRGFSVVADEVRTLASRTQDSTTEIQGVIEKLQKRADESVAVMNGSAARADETVYKATEAGSSLQKITLAATKINEMVQQIASATEEQTTAAKDINQSIHQVNDIAAQTATSVEESTQASDSLARLAEHLQSMVRKFKVS